jgi:hypothetical protein
MKTKKNSKSAVKGLGVFSRLTKEDAAFARKPLSSTARSPKTGRAKIVETLTTSEPSFRGGVAFKPLSGGGKIKKYYAG